MVQGEGFGLSIGLDIEIEFFSPLGSFFYVFICVLFVC